MRRTRMIRSLLSVTVIFCLHLTVIGGGKDEKASVKVGSLSAGSIQVCIINYRKIGNVHIEIRSAAGESLYIEEGKTNTTELIRQIDRTRLPRGDHQLTVTTRDFSITRQLVIE